MTYKHKQKKRTVFTAGKMYHIDTTHADLPGNVILNMFRKPFAGEETPDGLMCKTDEQGERSDYDVCIASFAITVSILFNDPENEQK